MVKTQLTFSVETYINHRIKKVVPKGNQVVVKSTER